MTEAEHISVGKRIFWGLFILYTVNVFAKVAFSAVTVELVDTGVMTKTEAGLINGMFWLIYGIGQIFGGLALKRLSPYTLMKITFIGSFLSNILIPVFDSFIPILLLWSFNGFIQCGFWPSVLRISSTDIPLSQRDKTSTMLSYCYGLGSILSYLLTSIILLFLPWQYMFIFCGVANLASAILVFVMDSRLKVPAELSTLNVCKNTGATERSGISLRFAFSSCIVLFCILVFIKSTTDTCIKNWMPNILTETYGASTSFTLILSVLLLFLNIVAVSFVVFIYRKLGRNEVKTVLLMGILALPLAVALIFYESMPMAVATVLMIVITMAFYSAGQIILINYPQRFYSYGLTAMIGGLINCFAAVGNVVASYGGGFIADNFGWRMLIVIWVVLIAVFVILALIAFPVWRRFLAKQK